MIAGQERDVPDTLLAQQLHCVTRGLADAVGDTDHPERLEGRADDDHRIAVARQRRHPAVKLGRTDVALGEESRAAEEDAGRAHDRFRAESRERFERVDRLERNALRCRARDDRATDRMLRPRFD